MNFEDYIEEARKTIPYSRYRHHDDQLVHGALGLVGEIGELEAAEGEDLVGELGDCFWYAALLVDAFEEGSGIIGLARSVARARTCRRRQYLERETKKLADLVEKCRFQGGSMTGDQVIQVIGVIGRLMAYAKICTEGVEHVLQRNIEKLRDRHGETFSNFSEQERE